MIINFKDTQSATIFAENTIAGLAPVLCKHTRRKMHLLNRATMLEELDWPHFHRLAALDGTRAGQHSLNVTTSHRICFTWTAIGAQNVELTLKPPVSSAGIARAGSVALAEWQRSVYAGFFD